ncbi:hypothetical protein ACFSLT_21130 [Novosphingobium resinovorum]
MTSAATHSPPAKAPSIASVLATTTTIQILSTMTALALTGIARSSRTSSGWHRITWATRSA